MARQLLVLRHAKSDWSASQTDYQRPLNPRGSGAASTVGKFFARAGIDPQLVVSSSAARARATAERVLEAAQLDCPLELDDALYESSVELTLQRLRRLDEALDLVMVVGHQPTWADLISHLSGGSLVHFPTAACACLDLLAPWSQLGAGGASLRWLVHPKLLAPLL